MGSLLQLSPLTRVSGRISVAMNWLDHFRGDRDWDVDAGDDRDVVPVDIGGDEI